MDLRTPECDRKNARVETAGQVRARPIKRIARRRVDELAEQRHRGHRLEQHGATLRFNLRAAQQRERARCGLRADPCGCVQIGIGARAIAPESHLFLAGACRDRHARHEMRGPRHAVRKPLAGREQRQPHGSPDAGAVGRHDGRARGKRGIFRATGVVEHVIERQIERMIQVQIDEVLGEQIRLSQAGSSIDVRDRRDVDGGRHRTGEAVGRQIGRGRRTASAIAIDHERDSRRQSKTPFGRHPVAHGRCPRFDMIDLHTNAVGPCASCKIDCTFGRCLQAGFHVAPLRTAIMHGITPNVELPRAPRVYPSAETFSRHVERGAHWKQSIERDRNFFTKEIAVSRIRGIVLRARRRIRNLRSTRAFSQMTYAQRCVIAIKRSPMRVPTSFMACVPSP